MARVNGAETTAHVAATTRRMWAAADLQAPLTTFVIAFAIFLLAFDHGAFATTTRTSVGVVAGCALALGIGVGVWPRARPSRAALACVWLLMAFALLQALSILWGAAGEDGVAEMSRTLLYAGVFVLVACAVRSVDVTRWADAIALGLTALTLVALASRFFPSLIDEGSLPQFLPDAHARLSYPVGYWNGLAVLCALGVPLLLRAACHAATLWVRGASIAPIPAIAAVVYLASSRTGAVVAIVGGVAFVAFTAERWRAGAALAVGATGGAAVIAFLSHRSALVNGPLDTSTAASQGRAAAGVVAAAAVAAGVVFAGEDRRLRRLQVPKRVGIATVAALAAVVCVGIAVSHPVARWHDFTSSPAAVPTASKASAHFASLNGNLRWQLWNSAVDMFRAKPIAGHGAGTFEPWWTRHGGNSLGFVGNAHSLYFQTLGELGIVGIVLVAAFAVVGVAAGAVRVLRAPPGVRPSAAAAFAGFVAFAVSLGLDWMWQLTAVSVVGVALLALVLFPRNDNRTRLRLPGWARAAAVLAAVALVVVQGDLLLAARAVDSSQSSAAAGDLGAAYSKAKRARSLEPWAATPYLQLALVAERQGRLVDAAHRTWQAIRRDRSDFRLWLVAARIDREAGRPQQARDAHALADRLAPRSFVVAQDTG